MSKRFQQKHDLHGLEFPGIDGFIMPPHAVTFATPGRVSTSDSTWFSFTTAISLPIGFLLDTPILLVFDGEARTSPTPPKWSGS